MLSLKSVRRALGVVAVIGMVLALPVGVQAQQRGGQEHLDVRYGHNHAYPVRGYATARLAPSAYSAHFGGRPYFFDRGVWYRPYRGFYSVIRPPFGIVVPVLPPFYTTVWFGGLPYYYANDTYYLWNSAQRGYIVTAPPQDPAAATTTSPEADQAFVYPKNGQTEAQQATDRYECHAWARQQTGFDPTEAAGGVDNSQIGAKRTQYQRAEQACLESRGYTVR